MSRPVLTLILLSGLTLLTGLGRQAITDSDEGFYAEAAREMVETGDWLTPHYNYEYRWEKPVLYYWLAAATYVVVGASEWAARLWSALAGIGLTLVTWGIARTVRVHSASSSAVDDTSAWLAAAMVATCFGYFAEARLALPDLLLAFLITLTIWSSLRAGITGRTAWWILAGVSGGLGLLTKGPVALILPSIVILPSWWVGRKDSRVSIHGIALATVMCLVVGLPWYVAMWRVHGTHYLRVFFLENNVQRFATEQYNGPRPVWFYVPIVLGGLMPWSAYLVTFAIAAATKLVRRRQGSDIDWPLVFWGLMPLLFYTASIGKQPRYILPVLPPLSILIARAMWHSIRHAQDARGGDKLLSAATWATAVVLAGGALLLVRAQPLFIHTYPAMTWIASAVIALCTVIVVWVAAKHRWQLLPAVLSLASAALLLAIQFGALAGKRPEAVEEMASLVRMHRTANEPVGEYHAFVRNLGFYLHFKQVEVAGEDSARGFVESADRVLLVASADDVAALQKTTSASLRVLGSVRYLNAADVKIRTILAPDPARDIETVLLVTNR